MKSQYVRDLSEGTVVDSEFVLRSKELRLTRAGEGYLTLDLGDRTGEVAAVLFRPDRLSTELPTGCVVTVRGVVTTFRGRRRVSVESMVPAEAYRREDMVPDGPRDRGELSAEFKRLVVRIEEPGLRALVRAVFADKAFVARFLSSPSSSCEDQPYVGGLLEHTVSVARACEQSAALHPELDADLLLAAALLHDIGKVDALQFDTAIAPTDEGRLLGHVALGHARLHAALASLSDPLPPGAAAGLCHAVLAHHEGADGSGVEPVTLEALLLRGIDKTERLVSCFLQRTQGAARAEERWTAKAEDGRSFYVPRRSEGSAMLIGAGV